MKGNAGPYFYLTVRRGAKVQKVYEGRGQGAKELAQLADLRRQLRDESQKARQRDQAETAVAEERLRELRELADVLVRAVLIGAGYHKHRGQWRRKRRDKRNGTRKGEQ